MAMASRVKDETLTESALTALRTAIVHGEFEPNQSLKILALRDQYGFGASPLREALSRLVGEGLVRLESNKGFRVAEFSRKDLDDIAFMRTAIEVHAIKRAIELGRADWEAGIVAALHKFTLVTNVAGTDRESLDNWQVAHDDFHSALISACGSVRVLDQQKVLAQQQDRYRRVLMGENFPRELLIAEHKGLADAALARDVRRILTLLESHFSLTSSFYGNALQDEKFDGKVTTDRRSPSQRRGSL